MKRTVNGHENNLPPPEVLNEILNGADTFLYVSDPQTDEILFINDNMKKHFHLGSEAVGSICWKVLQSGLNQRCTFCPLPRLEKNDGAPVVWEEHNTVTGRYYRNLDRLIPWHDGRLVHLQHSTDMTEIKLAELSLDMRLKQEKLMSAISQRFATTLGTPDLIQGALKMAGEFMGVNQALLSKYCKEEGHLECLYEWYDSQGQSYIDNASRWPISPDMDIYKDLMSNGYAAVKDYRLLTHPNFQAVKDYHLRAFLNIPVEISGEFWGIIGFLVNDRLHDWSESNIHLGKLLAGVFSGIISRNMAEEQLVEATKMAEQASRAKGEFLSHMSHEMRTPMNAIIGMTGIARKSGDFNKMEYCLARIDNASKQLLGLINDILDVSKIEANKLELSPSEFHFEKMLVSITEVVIFRIEEMGQSLVVNIDRNVPTRFVGDEMRLSQVLVNLLSNAAKFTPQGGAITLNVWVAGQQNGHMTLLFEVIDNGIGISKEKQEKLFDPFEQADANNMQKFGGAGLGLAISKGIVALMGGHIWVESERGHGSKFAFTIQVESGVCDPSPALGRIIDKEEIRVLAAGETLCVQQSLQREITDLGLPCDLAHSGKDALEKIRASTYRIAVIDWMLPDLDCVELAKKIKTDSPDTTVIMVIPQNDWSNIERQAVQAGINLFLYRPFFPSALIHALSQSLGIAQQGESSQAEPVSYDFSGHTLLVAEDIEINREILAAILEETRVSLDFAPDGAQAVAMFQENPRRYSLVLMDIQMPVLDGYQAAQQIRASQAPHATSIPIIAMTAHVYREDIDRCLAAGMNGHVGKPIDVDELLSRLDAYLCSGRSDETGEETVQ